MAASEDRRPAIGIDLGTSNSRVGIWLDEENRFKLFSNDIGNRLTPSYVAFTERERLIGDSAKEQVSKNPANTIFDAKRLIGRKFSELGTDSDKSHIQWPFRVACGKDDKPVIHIEYKGKEKVFPAEEVYAMILGQMKDLAEIASGSVVNGASVSVPHCFNAAQRQATRNACSIAGLETVILVNEPICAALAYTLANSSRPSLGEKKVLIFDLGGGSLDVTLFSIEEGVIEVKATSGDSQLGGEDFDLRLLHHFIREITEKHERDITSHPRVVRRLKNQVERVKFALSSATETSIQIDSLLEDFDFSSSISRAYFEEMNADLFGKCIKCVEDCLQRAQVEKADVYEVVLIGGSTHIPKVQQLLAEFFNDETKLKRAVDADEAVVCGAAARSGISRGCKAFADYLVVDVASMSLGLETVGGAMHVMHPRNSSIPKSCEQLFTTCYDDQPGIFLQIYEGENAQACGNLLIATMELFGIAPAPCGVPQILVRFDIDTDGILTALAKDKTTGQKVEVYLEDIDVASSRVNDDDERRQRLPIQVYRPSEIPQYSINSSEPRESSNFKESNPHEPVKTVETKPPVLSYLPSPPPPPVVSNIPVESSYHPPLASEFSNTVKSRSLEPHGSNNAVETTSQEFPQPPRERESSNNVESRFQGILNSPRSVESVAVESVASKPASVESLKFSEPAQEIVGSRNVVEGGSHGYGSRSSLENRAGEFSAPSAVLRSIGAQEVAPAVLPVSPKFPYPKLTAEPSPRGQVPARQIHGFGLNEITSQQLSESSQLLRSSGTPQVSSEQFPGPFEIQYPKSTAEPIRRGDLPSHPRLHEPRPATDARLQEFPEQLQPSSPSNALGSEPVAYSIPRDGRADQESKELEERPHAQLQVLSSGSAVDGEPSKFPFARDWITDPAPKEFEGRPYEQPPQAHSSSSALESEAEKFAFPRDWRTNPASTELVNRQLEQPEAYSCSNSLEREPEKFSSARDWRADEASKDLDVGLHERQQTYSSSDGVESDPNEFSTAMDWRIEQAPKELEDRPHELSEPLLQVHGVGSYESKQLDLPVLPLESRSAEFSAPSTASGSSNSAEIRSQEFSAANGSSNSVESSSHASLVQKMIEIVNVIAAISDFQAHKKECSAFIRRVNMLVPLFEEIRDLDVRFSEAVVVCFSAFETAFSTANALLLLCREGSKLYLILEQQKMAEQFLSVNAALVQALDKLPSSLVISEEVLEQVDLVRSQLKRSKGLDDPVESQLYTDLSAVLDSAKGRSPFQLTRLAESFKLDTAVALRKEFQALRGMMTLKHPPLDSIVNEREFDLVYGLLNDLRDLYPLEDDVPPQGLGASKVVKSSSQEFSAPPSPQGLVSPQAYESRSVQEVSSPISSGSMEGRPPSGPSQVYRATEIRPQESPPPVYKASHSFEVRSNLEAAPVYRPSKTFGNRLPHESSEPLASPRSSNASESRSQEFADSPWDRVPGYSGSRQLESSESSPVRSSGDGLASVPQQYSEPLQAYGTDNAPESRPDVASPTSRLSSRQQEYSELPPVNKSSKASESPREAPSEHSWDAFMERSRDASFERSLDASFERSIEDRSVSEAVQVLGPSKSSENRVLDSPEARISGNAPGSRPQSEEFRGAPDARVGSYTSGSRKLEPSESSPVRNTGNVRESRPQGSSEPLQVFGTTNSSEHRPHEASAAPRLRHEPAELSPMYKSSNASESSRQVSSEHTYKSSSTSDMSSEEFSGPRPLRAFGEMELVPELRRAETIAAEPLLRSPKPEDARSASCPQIVMTDSIIEDVVKKYSWDQVLEMTNNLTSRQLGKGGFGAVFLGTLENGKEVAVKILDASSQQGISEFLNEVNLLKRVNHVNLIRLLGYCQDERQVLIYEFAEEGSIWDHLQAGGSSLEWKRRLNIALQSACGLEYLHTGCSPRIIHRDIKSQNILLTRSMVAKVADFGLSKLGADQENLNKTHVTTMVKGTLGYLDPEYLKTGQLTEKSDVYSFGVILMEIITGRKPIQNSEKKCFIGDWVEEHYNAGAGGRALKAVADPSLGGHFNPKSLKRVVEIAKLCTQPFGANRPDMTDVVRALRKAQAAELDEKKSKWLTFLS